MTWVHLCLILLAIAWTCVWAIVVGSHHGDENAQAVGVLGWAAGLTAMAVAFIALWGWS